MSQLMNRGDGCSQPGTGNRAIILEQNEHPADMHVPLNGALVSMNRHLKGMPIFRAKPQSGPKQSWMPIIF